MSDRWIKTSPDGGFGEFPANGAKVYGHYAACRPLVEGFDTMSGVAQVRGTG